jgi:hypothetical protein
MHQSRLHSLVLMACARLHNFCIDMDQNSNIAPEDNDNGSVARRLQNLAPRRGAPLGWSFLPTAEPYRPIPGTSMTRDMILRRVEERGMRRPNANLERRRYELHEIGLM